MVPRFASCTGAEQLTIYLRKLGEEGLTPADFIVLRTGAVVVEPKVKKPNQKPQPIPVFGVIRYVFACPHGNDAMFCEDCEKGETVIPPKHGEVAH